MKFKFDGKVYACSPENLLLVPLCYLGLFFFEVSRMYPGLHSEEVIPVGTFFHMCYRSGIYLVLFLFGGITARLAFDTTKEILEKKRGSDGNE